VRPGTHPTPTLDPGTPRLRDAAFRVAEDHFSRPSVSMAIPRPPPDIRNGEVEEVVTQVFGSQGTYLGSSLAPDDTEKLKAAPSGIGAPSRL